MQANSVDFSKLHFAAGQVFNPNTPVSVKDLFSGRTRQINRVLEVISQVGQHAIIFGERGVGKTSLANVLSAFAPTQSALMSTRINSDKSDTFSTVWKKIFDNLHFEKGKATPSFKPEIKRIAISTREFFPDIDNITPNDVKNALLVISENVLPVLIIDEFDRLSEDERRIFSDLIKSLSDYSLSATIVLIGVGSSVEDIIKEHQSVSRALVQIQMPRMTKDEILGIITNSLSRLGMNINEKALDQIALLSKGLPHYAHLIGLHATREALKHASLTVSVENVGSAVVKAVEDAQHSIRTTYHNAIRSSRKDNLFAEVLLACAIAETNELDEFAAQDLRTPLHKITGEDYSIAAYVTHLSEFSDNKRGNILLRSGQKRRYRYKFNDPLMQPFVIMQGLLNKKITSETIV